MDHNLACLGICVLYFVIIHLHIYRSFIVKFIVGPLCRIKQHSHVSSYLQKATEVPSWRVWVSNIPNGLLAPSKTILPGSAWQLEAHPFEFKLHQMIQIILQDLRNYNSSFRTPEIISSLNSPSLLFPLPPTPTSQHC